MKLCATRSCPEYAMDGSAHCPPHDVQARARKKSLASQRGTARPEIYRTRRWRKVRLLVLRRDDFTCVVCGRNEVELGGPHNLVADHVGGDYSDPFNPDKLRTLCRRCSGEEDGGRRTNPA